MGNWYQNNKEKLSSQEQWICGIMESILRAIDKNDMNSVFSLSNVLKTYLSGYDESQSTSEKINNFIKSAKNLLLSSVDTAHKEANKLVTVVRNYEQMKL